jgi:cytosine/adenosine deaminase-related metal-dependent hydrolase
VVEAYPPLGLGGGIGIPGLVDAYFHGPSSTNHPPLK